MTFEEIAKKVRWEKNSLVVQNPNIFEGQIIPKTTTYDFPCDATTVRFHSISKRMASAYIYGKGGKPTWSNKIRPSSKLIVTMPWANKHGEFGYSWNGDSQRDKSEQDITDILRYIKGIVNEMKDSRNA